MVALEYSMVGSVDGLLVDGLLVDGLFVDGLLVDGLFVDGLLVDGLFVDGLLVDGLLVDGLLVDGLSVGDDFCVACRVEFLVDALVDIRGFGEGVLAQCIPLRILTIDMGYIFWW